MKYVFLKKSIKYIKENFKKFWWLLPFLTFYLGYWIPQVFFKTPSLETPSLIGKNIYESLILLSKPQLNVRLIDQKEDSTLPEGTVISQVPAPYQQIKRYQTVFITASKKPALNKAPLCQGKFQKEIEALLSDQKIKFKFFFIESSHPSGYCIAQYPSAQEELHDKSMILYFSQDREKTVLFPNLENISVEKVKYFLKNYGITPHIFHTKPINKEHQCTHCIVTEQKPLSGSFVNLKHPFSVQLKVLF